ncbi:amino acid ABC transporter permease [Thermoflavimicrobium dichotomicum]|uniref:L-cystine transport system permease protein n=1 Tax=Thermoflavimicrobium dichotomicum TaxID=46223 RepID=A0A1I3U2E5_9BACL|nr:amino acid ABC transporter permease [Thermoflavimicrobium dichotomicum]SFJ77085.1 L-cystine transport system permease protein [Thermoflavimicrobium dichotomicum]
MGKSFDLNLVFDFLPKLLSYLHITLLILVGAVLIGLLVGFLAALPRIYNIPVLRTLSAIYVSFIRGTPILIQLFLVYYGLPELLKTIQIDVTHMSSLVFVIITYGFSIGALFSEIIRAAVSAVDRGQTEAAYAIGMTPIAAFVRIVLPQALTIAFPNFANLVISYLKDTSLAFYIGVMDMTGRGQTLGTATNHFLEVYISLAIIYYAVCILLEKCFSLLETRMLRYERQFPVSQ